MWPIGGINLGSVLWRNLSVRWENSSADLSASTSTTGLGSNHAERNAYPYILLVTAPVPWDIQFVATGVSNTRREAGTESVTAPVNTISCPAMGPAPTAQ